MKDLPVTDAAHKAIGITNKRAGYYRKFKIDRNDVRAIITTANLARQFHRNMTVPWGRDLYRMLPATLILKYTKAMKDYKHQFFGHVDDLVVRWPKVLQSSKTRLGSAFNTKDYPSASEVKDFYLFDTHFKPVPQDDHFILEVEAETLEELKANFNTDQQENMEQAMKSLWHRLFEVVERMSTVLNDPPKGKKPKIFKTLVTNIEELVEILPELNLDNDPKLTGMTQRIADELCKFTPGQLRRDPNARNNVAKSAKKIQDDMSAIMGGGVK